MNLNYSARKGSHESSGQVCPIKPQQFGKFGNAESLSWLIFVSACGLSSPMSFQSELHFTAPVYIIYITSSGRTNCRFSWRRKSRRTFAYLTISNNSLYANSIDRESMNLCNYVRINSVYQHINHKWQN